MELDTLDTHCHLSDKVEFVVGSSASNDVLNYSILETTY